MLQKGISGSGAEGQTMQKGRHFLLVASIAAGLVASINVAFGADPYNCRLKVRTEMGIAPYTGQYYAGFWERVGRCIQNAQGGPALMQPTTRVNQEQSAERSSKKSAQSPKPEMPSATAPSPTLPKPAIVGEFGRRVALVIGNGKYQHVPVLPNATNDAEALAKALKATGFQSVTLRIDLTRDQLLSTLAEFARVADTADWATVYYSGHGIESRGVNYMIPVDAELKVDRDVDLETVDVSKVLSMIEGARKLKLVILDACRDNPFLGQMKRTVASRSITRGLGPIEPDPGVLIVYAAKHGETALDGDGKNSPFATALINRIQTPNLELRRLFDLVRDDVLAATGRRQQPFSYGSLSGSEDFFFETK
jgi:hypothetical protein